MVNFQINTISMIIRAYRFQHQLEQPGDWTGVPFQQSPGYQILTELKWIF